VLQVVTSTDRRGAETSAIELAGALERRGLAVRTVALAPGASGGLEVPALGRSALGVHALRALRREAQRAGVVVAHGSRTLPACAIALLGTRVPFVYRNIGDPRFWAASPLRRARTRAFLARARAVVALTAESSSILSDRYGVAPARVTVIPNGVASARHRPADSSARAAARAALGLPNGVPVVAVIGALRPEKDVGLAIDAVACVEGAHLLVVGDGPERLAAEASAQRVAPGRVHFTGSLADPGPAFDAADVVALTSRTEGVPAVLVEAGLRAIPVVTTDVGFVRDVVAHGVTGLVVTQREPIALSVAIRRALASPDLGVAARRRCAERFDLEPVADAWAFLLDSTRDPRDHHSA